MRQLRIASSLCETIRLGSFQFPLETYEAVRREMDDNLSEINDTSSKISEPHGPTRRRPLRSDFEINSNMYNGSSPKEEQMKHKPYSTPKLNDTSKKDERSSDSSDRDIHKQVISDIDQLDTESDEEEAHYLTSKSLNRTRTISPERTNTSLENSKKESSRKKRYKSPNIEQSVNGSFSLITKIAMMVAVAGIIFYLVVTNFNSMSGNQKEFISSRSLIFKSIEDVKTKFYNQDSYIWNDISSGINEVKTRSPKTPSIILLFANETHTMDCLASALAHLSSNVLGGDSPLNLDPKDFGNDPGEIINTMKNLSTKKAVIIRDILNINAEAIKSLHNLCDRVNPLIREVVYILTMQTKNYDSSQGKMIFLEKQFHRKLSKSIDEDTLMALVTRVTDGAIIWVQPESSLRYC